MDSANRGSLTEIDFIEVLKNASRSDLTGMIRVEKGPIIKVVYFQNGTIAFASSNQKSDRLTEVLKRAGKLTAEQVEDAQTRLRPNISLGKTLVELGYISARDLLWGARTQVEGILHELVFWKEGLFQVLEEMLPKEIIVLNLSVPGIIFDAICKTRDRQWVLDHIGSPQEVYRLAPDFHEKYVPHKLRMMRADDFVSRVNGKRTLEEIAHLAGMDTFEVCKIAVALQCLSLLQRSAEPVQMTLAPVPETFAEKPALASGQIEEVAPEPFDEPFSISEPEPALVGMPATAQREEVSLGQILEIPSVQELQVPESAGIVFQEEEPPTAVPEEPEAAAAEPAIVEAFLNETTTTAVEHKEQAPTLLEDVTTRAQYEEVEEPVGRRWTGPVMIAAIVIAGVLVSGWFYLQKVSRASVTSAQTTPPVQTASVGQKSAPPTEQPQIPASSPEPPVQPVITTPAPVPEPAQIPKPEMPTTAAAPGQPPASVDGVSLIGAGRIAEAAQKWKAQLSIHHAAFVVQVLIACQEKTINDTLSLFSDKSSFRLLPLQYRGQVCYRVLVGPFGTSEEAQSARNNLPAILLQQPSPPQVINLGQILK